MQEVIKYVIEPVKTNLVDKQLHSLVQDITYVIFSIFKDDISANEITVWLDNIPKKRGRSNCNLPCINDITWFRYDDDAVLW